MATALDPNEQYAVNLRSIWQGFRAALAELPAWERGLHIFWVMGPFILLIERTPADIWVSLIALTFAGRAVYKKEGWWLKITWVRLAFLFWAACLLSAGQSVLPAYSVGEAFVWFRFPLFAMAITFWLGRDERILYFMLLVTGVGMVIMCGILAAELAIIGHQNGRLSWPYGDLLPGNYLA